MRTRLLRWTLFVKAEILSLTRFAAPTGSHASPQLSGSLCFAMTQNSENCPPAHLKPSSSTYQLINL